MRKLTNTEEQRKQASFSMVSDLMSIKDIIKKKFK
jgi:hypothetical protein